MADVGQAPVGGHASDGKVHLGQIGPHLAPTMPPGGPEMPAPNQQLSPDKFYHDLLPQSTEQGQPVGSAAWAGHALHSTPTAPHEMRPGDWLCHHCASHNFASRVQCFRCRLPKLGSVDPSVLQHTSHSTQQQAQVMRHGDWICTTCNNHNFATRYNCYRCGLGKTVNAVLHSSPSPTAHFNPHFNPHHHPHHHPHHQVTHGVRGRRRDIEMRPGDWVCQLCRNHNFASKHACNRCNTSKGLAYSRQGVRELRPGDWLCTACSNVNFAGRLSCNMCHSPKTDDAATINLSSSTVNHSTAGARVADAATRLVDRAPNGPARNWNCANCGNSNFERSSACHVCKVWKSTSTHNSFTAENGWLPMDSHKPTRSPERPTDGFQLLVGGDWSCTCCSSTNFGHYKCCYRCGEIPPRNTPVQETVTAPERSSGGGNEQEITAVVSVSDDSCQESDVGHSTSSAKTVTKQVGAVRVANEDAQQSATHNRRSLSEPVDADARLKTRGTPLGGVVDLESSPTRVLGAESVTTTDESPLITMMRNAKLISHDTHPLPSAAEQTAAAADHTSASRDDIGNAIFPLICVDSRVRGDRGIAAKLTGMILDGFELEELATMMGGGVELTAKVGEALALLDAVENCPKLDPKEEERTVATTDVVDSAVMS